jgi:hypothetical protein
MTTFITQKVHEGSTAVFSITMTDDAGAAVIPSSATWSLFDKGQNVINSREDVVLTPGLTMTVVLEEDDLTIGETEVAPFTRYLVAYGEYDSDAGNGLVARDQAKFLIEPTMGFPAET